MELLNNKEEILYKISDEQFRTKEQIISYKLQSSLNDIPADWRNRKFSDFDNTALKDYAGKLKHWDFKVPAVAGIISEMNGIGKTHLATCVYKKYIYEKLSNEFDRIIPLYEDSNNKELLDWINNTPESNNYSFLSEKKLALIIQDTFNNKKANQTQLSILEYYCDLSFLIIDDCFSLKQNEFARQNIFYIIDERAEWNNKPTFVTSNLNLSEIADIDTRIADRIRTSLLFQPREKIKSFRELK